jgi:hypothetical protein
LERYDPGGFKHFLSEFVVIPLKTCQGRDPTADLLLIADKLKSLDYFSGFYRSIGLFYSFWLQLI